MRSTVIVQAGLVIGLLAGCSAPGFDEARMSLPAPGEPARLVVRVDEQPVTLRFDAAHVDYAEWTPHDVDEEPPHPLEELPPGSRPRAAWVLRVRLRGTPALVPAAYMAMREGSGLLYVTRRTVGRLEPGAGFDVLPDGSVRVSNPAAPPPVEGFMDIPIETK